MNKTLLLGVIASLLVLSGCASQATCKSQDGACNAPAPVHHDYKGETK